jgi:RimJ/RimL family protein N-acetyltransferase
MKCYVFRLMKKNVYPNLDMSDFVMLDSFSKTLKHLPVLATHLDRGKIILQLIRSLFSNRYFYYLSKQGKITTCGQLSTGFCHYYSVNISDVVIGSIWTDPEHRGEGLASKGMQAAINYMIADNWSVFYIDTQETNNRMLKVIENNGFGQSIIHFEN